MIVIVSKHVYKYNIIPDYVRKVVKHYSLVLFVPLMSDRIGDLTLNLKSLRI